MTPPVDAPVTAEEAAEPLTFDALWEAATSTEAPTYHEEALSKFVERKL